MYSQDESSEEFVGEWMNKRGIRDQIVIATKVDFSSSISPSYVCIKRDLLSGLVYDQLQKGSRRFQDQGKLRWKQRQKHANQRGC